MGVFVENTLSYDNGYNLQHPENYDGAVGRLNIMVEAYQDDMDFFTSVIRNDVAEVTALKEGLDIEAITESAIGDAFKKLREFIGKIWKKIKALFEAFIARVTGFVAKDGKAYAKKYYSLGAKNIADGRCSKIKYKYRKQKSGSKNIDFNGINNIVQAVDFANSPGSGIDGLVFKLSQKDHTLDKSDIQEEVIDVIFSQVKGSTYKELKKELVDYMLEDEESEEGIDVDLLSKCKIILEGNSKEVDGLKKDKTTIDRSFTEMLKLCDKAEKKNDSLYKVSKDGDEYEDVTGLRTSTKMTARDGLGGTITSSTFQSAAVTTQRKISACREVLTVAQEVVTTGISAQSEVISRKFKDARKIMSLAASAAGRKKVNESYGYDDDEMELDFILGEEAAFVVDGYMYDPIEALA